jgi:hypothetical protein
MEERCFNCLRALRGGSTHGLHQECFRNWFGVDGSHTPFQLTMKTSGNSNDPNAEINFSFFHGKFRKYSAKLGRSSYIIKVRQPSFPDLPAMEFLCNQLAKKLGVNVPDFYFILLERFIKLCLFDVFIGNHDRHGRNLALIQTAQGKLLSPTYDNPSCLGIEEESFLKAILEPCGKIHSSRSKEPKMREYALDFCEMGYEKLVRQFYLSIAFQEIVGLVSTSFISLVRKTAFSKLLHRRYHELKEAIDAYSNR